jgi:glycerol-1-phosphate dehydrogenase [NAD(P)+]
MHTEEKHIKELEDLMPDGIQLMIAVGSGTMNDVTRYISFRKNIPYYIVGTAPSMDGYASDVSPVIINNLKVSLPAHCASGIIGDTNILATAPEKMIAAGVGDIMAKFLDINDWRVSHIINDESYCDEVAELMLYSAEKCVNNIEGLVNREDDALQYLMESLVLIGIAMAYVNSSRPGSAAEHSMAHVMEMTSLLNGQYGELHGTCVGMATCVITRLYDKFLQNPIDYQKAYEHAETFDYSNWTKEIKRIFTSAADPIIKLYEKEERNRPDHVKARIKSIQNHESEIIKQMKETLEKSRRAEGCIQALNGWVSPVQFGFTKEHMRDIILYSKEQRDRYAALQFLYEMGCLSELTDELLDEYYGEEM